MNEEEKSILKLYKTTRIVHGAELKSKLQETVHGSRVGAAASIERACSRKK